MAENKAETQVQEAEATLEENVSYTQADVDKLVKDAVADAVSKFSDYQTLKADSDELKKLRDADKSELEKAQERAAAAEKERDALIAEKNAAKWKKEISDETGVPVEVLEGTTKEEIKAHAERLKPYFPKDSAPIIKSDGHAPRNTAGRTTAQQFADILEGIL